MDTWHYWLVRGRKRVCICVDACGTCSSLVSSLRVLGRVWVCVNVLYKWLVATMSMWMVWCECICLWHVYGTWTTLISSLHVGIQVCKYMYTCLVAWHYLDQRMSMYMCMRGLRVGSVSICKWYGVNVYALCVTTLISGLRVGMYVPVCI